MVEWERTNRKIKVWSVGINLWKKEFLRVWMDIHLEWAKTAKERMWCGVVWSYIIASAKSNFFLLSNFTWTSTIFDVLMQHPIWHLLSANCSPPSSSMLVLVTYKIIIYACMVWPFDFKIIPSLVPFHDLSHPLYNYIYIYHLCLWSTRKHNFFVQEQW